MDSRAQMLRILPRLNEVVNEEWISTKHVLPAMALKPAVGSPYIAYAQGNLCQLAGRCACESRSVENFSSRHCAAIAGDQVELESLYALKLLLKAHGIHKLNVVKMVPKLPPRRGRIIF